MAESRNLNIFEQAIQNMIDDEAVHRADIEKFWEEHKIDPEDYEININECDNRTWALEDALEVLKETFDAYEQRLPAIYEEYGVGYR
jgi:hypothetical protein